MTAFGGALRHRTDAHCRRAMAKVCRCLVPGAATFRVCCGYYCNSCGGHDVDGASPRRERRAHGDRR